MLIFLAYTGNYTYFCIVDHNAKYDDISLLTTDCQDDAEGRVELFGELLPADAALLQRRMTMRRLPLEEQMALWRNLYRQWPDPDWVRECLERVRDIKSLISLDRTLFPASDNSASSAIVSARPTQPTVERHFVWLGDRYAIGVEPLRDGIAHLAAAGLIASDRGQQQALRRCLGLTVNDDERSSDPPWVLWLGPSDMLNHLVDTLWKLELIHCAGGNRQKWQTLCGAFLRADGTRFTPSIKSNRCTNPEKLKTLDRALLSALRFLRGKDS